MPKGSYLKTNLRKENDILTTGSKDIPFLILFYCSVYGAIKVRLSHRFETVVIPILKKIPSRSANDLGFIHDNKANGFFCRFSSGQTLSVNVELNI
ncbi:hypothetical protein CEXT_210941 [Caerostris extrusa]|uniref:LAGLIDADG homing endonuclease n=1 Tax=Caerostris extrusa TaxID=172846 RepID=A0AAV4M8R8_CAEEX|nr:hypothetical protein CEXT_210941 [Caerostris extrusa]